MTQLYTPWMTQAGQTAGNVIAQQGQNKLYSSAYMGESGAMERLMQVNPAMGQQLIQQKQQSEQLKLEQSAQLEEKRKKILSEKRTIIQDYAKNMAKFETFEEANQYKNDELARLKESDPDLAMAIGDGELTPDHFKQLKSVYGEKPKEGFTLGKDQTRYDAQGKVIAGGATQGSAGAFEGTGMPAQISNALVRGASDPAYRNTPEYHRAWDLANTPEIIDTEQGRIPLYPKLSPLFKAPGESVSESEQVKEIKEEAEKDSKVIEGTEKKVITTADEKLSSGFYGRMVAAEDNIKNLGNYDSASLWEKTKAITNVTASPEYQQYKQAADDWIRSKLRRESGAVIGNAEMQKEYEVYFPQFGDSQQVLDQKKQARAQAAQSMKIAAGRSVQEEPAKQQKIADVPAVGAVMKGYVFLGGDPAKPESWRKQ